MKFFLKLVALGSIVLIVAFILASCKKSEIKVGFMLPNIKTERYQAERDVFLAKGKELGVQVLFAEADNNEEKQIQQLQVMLKDGIDILVLDPVNRFRAAGMVRMAHDKGIK
jgi:D-xylose transport system substrate-binding protein